MRVFSKSARRFFIAGVIAGLSVLSILDRVGCGPVRDDVRRRYVAGDDRVKYHNKRAEVVNVVDGDTLDIDIPDGKWDHTRIRLLGVDTPETVHPKKGVMYYGPEASERASELAEGREVRVVIDHISKSRDHYGRLVAYVVLPGGEMLNEKLVREGYGYADPRFPHSRREEFAEFQRDAREAERGLWEGISEKELPDWVEVIDEAGNLSGVGDDENLGVGAEFR
jgi:micrococcal nuclease